MSLTGGGAPKKRWRRPHERGLSVPKEPALLRDLEANQTAVLGPRRDRLNRLPLPWRAGRSTNGRRNGMCRQPFFDNRAQRYARKSNGGAARAKWNPFKRQNRPA